MRILREITAAIVYIAAAPARVRHTPGPAGIMTAGAMWGLLMIGLWELTSRLTWPGLMNWVIPAIACSAVTVLGAYRRAFLAGFASLPRIRRPVQWIALTAAAAGWAVILNDALRWWDPDWPTQQLSPAIIWLWPRALYRVLLLAPVWGSWSMLAVTLFHRPTGDADSATRELARRTSPLVGALWLAAPLAGSFVYLMFLPQRFRFVAPAVAIAAALAGGCLFVRLRSRVDRQVLLATNALTQTAFLMAYLVVK